MEALLGILDLIANGGVVHTDAFAELLMEMTEVHQRGVLSWPLPCDGEHCFVVGPIRGHAAEAADLLRRRWHSIVDQSARFIFLGNAVDGGDHSVETLFVLLSMQKYAGHDRCLLLRGAHEQSFPHFPHGPHGLPTTLTAELRVRQLQSSIALESLVLSYFQSLPIACVVGGKYLCVGSGISPLCETVASMEAAMAEKNTKALHHFVWNEPMDDDDQYSLPDSVQFAASEEFDDSFVFSFQAACRFLSRNALRTIFRGSHYAADRTSDARNRCGRPWHFQHAPYDPGYRLHPCHPHTGFPSIISLFSAPAFCDRNKNFGAYAAISTSGVALHQTERCQTRPLQLPGCHRNAFAWSLPLMLTHVRSAVLSILAEPVEDRSLADEAQLRRMRLMAELCISNGYALPVLGDAPTA